MSDRVELRRLVVGFLDTNCWILKPAGEREALIVDPGDEPGRIAAAVADLDVVGIVLTHAHADHVLGLAQLAQDLQAPIIGHPAESQVWAAELGYLAEHGHLDGGTATADLIAQGNPPRPDPNLPLWNGHFDQSAPDEITVGSLTVDVLHTPGHTPGSLTLSTPGHLFTGDTLFPGGPGLTGPDWPLSDFPQIISSVTRLLDLPAETTIHPGHGPPTPPSAPNAPTWPPGKPEAGNPNPGSIGNPCRVTREPVPSNPRPVPGHRLGTGNSSSVAGVVCHRSAERARLINYWC